VTGNEPGVPDDDERDLQLPCGERVDPVAGVDMGMRAFDCDCGDRHAVVMDVHPPSRFLPEEVVATLRDTVEATDESEFSTRHLLGMVREEFPEAVASEDVSEDGSAGYALVWVTTFDDRRLHEVVVELVVELMEHAVGHAESPDAEQEFEADMQEFDVAAFVDRYRAMRDFEDEGDSAV
jgi:hypothetical protein